jgi:hypothetical protein
MAVDVAFYRDGFALLLWTAVLDWPAGGAPLPLLTLPLPPTLPLWLLLPNE